MNYEVLKILLEYEAKAEQNIAEAFSISLNEKKMLLKVDEDGTQTEVELPQDLHQTLTIFFNSNESVPYQSDDYNMLKSLLNAYACLHRMKNK